MSTPPDTPAPHNDRLGDLLVRQNRLAPHQVGVALDVQRRTRLPFGRILVETRIVSRTCLYLALLQQKLNRLLRWQHPRRLALYGADLVSRAKNRLASHLRSTPAQDAPPDLTQTVQLRNELAGLDPKATGRIVETDEALKQRLMSGNF